MELARGSGVGHRNNHRIFPSGAGVNAQTIAEIEPDHPTIKIPQQYVIARSIFDEAISSEDLKIATRSLFL